MKKLKLITAVAALLAIGFTARAQTSTNADIYDNIGAVLGNLGLSSHPTNYAAATFLGHSIKGQQLSAGQVVVENVNNNIGVAAGIDHLWYGGKTGSANVVAGGITLKAPAHPLTFLSSDTNSWTHKFTVSPFAIALVGTPINGTGNANGGLASITRAGLNFDLANIKGWELGAGIDWGKRTGAGNYSGDWADVSLSIRKGF
jgi:hypothetical protein